MANRASPLTHTPEPHVVAATTLNDVTTTSTPGHRPDPREGAGFGANSWLVEEMYEQYQDDPDSVNESWREFFGNGDGAAPAPSESAARSPEVTARGEGSASDEPHAARGESEADAEPAIRGVRAC